MRSWWTSAPRPSAPPRGELPGALPVERNVLEWRFDLSSLAAAALQELGAHRATDVIGGWAADARSSEATTAA